MNNKKTKFKVGDRISWPNEPGIVAVIDRIDFAANKYYYTFIEYPNSQWRGAVHDYDIDELEKEHIEIKKFINYNSYWAEVNGS